MDIEQTIQLRDVSSTSLLRGLEEILKASPPLLVAYTEWDRWSLALQTIFFCASDDTVPPQFYGSSVSDRSRRGADTQRRTHAAVVLES